MGTKKIKGEEDDKKKSVFGRCESGYFSGKNFIKGKPFLRLIGFFTRKLHCYEKTLAQINGM